MRRTPSGVAEIAALSVLLLASRLAILAVLAAFTGGREFSDDPVMHLDMASRPFDLLLGRTAVHGQHPVLLPVVEWVLLAPFRGFGDFVAVRAAMLSAEVITFLAVVPAIGPRHRRLAALAWIASPVAFVSSVVMPQDELVAAAFLATGLLLVGRGAEPAALVVLGLGVAAGKIFLGIPLFALVLLGRWRSWPARLVLGGLPAALPTVISAALALHRGEPLPLQGFTPDAPFGVTPWVWLLQAGVPAALAKPVSAVLAASGALVPMALALRGGRGVATFPAVVGAATLNAFLLFYHVNPEYFVLVLVPAAWVLVRCRELPWLHVSLALPWLVNVFYGIGRAAAGTTSPGKQRFVDLWQRVTALDPTWLAHGALALATIALVLLAVGLARRVA